VCHMFQTFRLRDTEKLISLGQTNGESVFVPPVVVNAVQTGDAVAQASK
jgi:hypothetical protein